MSFFCYETLFRNAWFFKEAIRHGIYYAEEEKEIPVCISNVLPNPIHRFFLFKRGCLHMRNSKYPPLFWSCGTTVNKKTLSFSFANPTPIQWHVCNAPSMCSSQHLFFFECDGPFFRIELEQHQSTRCVARLFATHHIHMLFNRLLNQARKHVADGLSCLLFPKLFIQIRKVALCST